MRPVLRSGNGRSNYLALSAGGESGAYGAGVLVGWSETGKRPQFDLVRGVSVGALIAPFAFVGSQVDHDLEHLFDSGIAARLNSRRSILSGLLGESIASAAPLKALIADYVDRDLLDLVADRHRQGARLLVVTTNIDAERSVVWDMGAIAASGNPDAVRLFSDVLAASASIPAYFPPTEIAAVVDGQSFNELHVDGGAIRQIFFFPDAYLEHPDWRGVGPSRPHVYAIANHEITPRFEPIKDRAVSVAEASYRTLVKASLVQTLYQMESFADDNGLAFFLTYIGDALPSNSKKPFDPQYMKTAYALGVAAGKAQSWMRSVPIGENILSVPSPE